MVRVWPNLMLRFWPNLGDNKSFLGPESNQCLAFVAPKTRKIPVPLVEVRKPQQAKKKKRPEPDLQYGKNDPHPNLTAQIYVYTFVHMYIYINTYIFTYICIYRYT